MWEGSKQRRKRRRAIARERQRRSEVALPCITFFLSDTFFLTFLQYAIEATSTSTFAVSGWIDFIAHNLRSEFSFSTLLVIAKCFRKVTYQTHLPIMRSHNATRKQQQEEGTEKNNTCIEMKTLIRVRFSIVACWVLLALATV